MHAKNPDPIVSVKIKEFVAESKKQVIHRLEGLLRNSVNTPTLFHLDGRFRGTEFAEVIKKNTPESSVYYTPQPEKEKKYRMGEKYTIIAVRTLTLSGFAYYNITLTDASPEVAYAYASATFVLQFLLGQFNDLELKYIAHKLKFKVRHLKKFKNPLSLDSSRESSMPSQISKWVLLEAIFLAGIESAKVLSANTEFSALSIMSDVFETGLLTAFMQMPLDSLNAIYTQRKLKSAVKNYVTGSSIQAIKNIANVRATTISIYSTLLALIVLNPEGFGDKLPIDIKTYMIATGAVYHSLYIAYKKNWLQKLRPKPMTCNLLFNPI